MDLMEKIQKKIGFDFLFSKTRKSFLVSGDVNKIDKKSASLILEMCGYDHLEKRELDLYCKTDKDVVVLDEGFGRYFTDIEDVVKRKAPTIKEMLSFRNARKILNDSDVLETRKEDTLLSLRSEFLDDLRPERLDHDIEKLYENLIVYLDAKANKEFLKSLLIFCEFLNFKYIPFASQKTKAQVFGGYSSENNENYLLSMIIFDEEIDKFLLFKDRVKEKDLKKYIKDIIKGERKEAFENRDALLELKKSVQANKEYDYLKTDIFSIGTPEKLDGF